MFLSLCQPQPKTMSAHAQNVKTLFFPGKVHVWGLLPAPAKNHVSGKKTCHWEKKNHVTGKKKQCQKTMSKTMLILLLFSWPAGLPQNPRPSRGPRPSPRTPDPAPGRRPPDPAHGGPAVFGNPGFFSVFSSHCFFQSACRDMGLAPSGLILSDKPGLVLPT